jgi:hypothetical protein
MTTSFRPLTAKQRAELKGYVAWGTTVFGIVLCVGLIFIIASAFHFLHSQLVKVFPGISHALWWIAPTAIVVLFIGRVLMRGMQNRAFRAQVRSDLARDELAVHRIDAVEAIEVEEQEDEGQTFFIKTTDGETMFFSGQYLDSYTRRGFPWKSFEILESPSSKIFLGLKKIGDPLSPSFVRQPFTSEEAKQFRCHSSEYATIKDDFESLKIKASAEQKISEAI